MSRVLPKLSNLFDIPFLASAFRFWSIAVRRVLISDKLPDQIVNAVKSSSHPATMGAKVALPALIAIAA
jgi:hypothetical protein